MTLAGTDVTLTGFNVDIDGVLGFLTNWLINFFEGDIASQLENQFRDAVQGEVGPLLADALTALAFDMDFDLPRLDGAVDPDTGEPATITLSLESDFAYTDFTGSDPQGGVLGLRARAHPSERGVPEEAPYLDNLGAAMRVGCALGPQMLVIPKAAPIEIVFADDTLNMILWAAWYGGLMEFPVPAEMLGDFDLSALGIAVNGIDVSALLPPLASDCGPDGALRLSVADLKVIADMDFLGSPLTITVYLAFEAGVELSSAGGELGVAISDLEQIEMELRVSDESRLSLEPVFEDLIMDQLLPEIEAMLGGGEPLFSFPLPEIDLSESLGAEPGSLMISIETLQDDAWAPRIDGNTIVYGRLK